jgi:hypothetical protein
VLDRAAVTAEVAARIAEDATAEVLVLPSPQAPTQALVTVLDAAGAGGALRVRVVRIAEDSEAGAAAGTGGDGSGSGGIGALR